MCRKRDGCIGLSSMPLHADLISLLYIWIIEKLSKNTHKNSFFLFKNVNIFRASKINKLTLLTVSSQFSLITSLQSLTKLRKMHVESLSQFKDFDMS